MTPFRAEAKDRKMIIQRGGALNSKAGHHCKAGAIDDGEILVAPKEPKLPCGFQVRQSNGLNNRYSASQPVPESISGVRLEPVVKQRPGFYQNVIRGNQCLTSSQDRLCARITQIGSICRSIPDRCVDK